MEETIFCVFCGNPLYGKPKAHVSAVKVRKAVASGFFPEENAVAVIGADSGMSREETRQAFLDDVHGLESDWIICPKCAKKVEAYSTRQKYQMSQKTTLILLVVSVILLILVLYSMGIFRR